MIKWWGPRSQQLDQADGIWLGAFRKTKSNCGAFRSFASPPLIFSVRHLENIQMLKTIWKDPVGSKVIASGLVVAIAAAGTYFLNLWPTIKRALTSSISFLGKTSELPNWLIILMSIFSIILIAFVGIIIWQNYFSTSGESAWKNYKEDIFFNIKWQWQYDSSGAIYCLYSLCPKCQFQVYPVNASPYSAVDRIAYVCESCKSHLGTFNQDEFSFENKIKRFIQQKIRTGAYVPENA